MQRINGIAAVHAKALDRFRDDGRFANVRQIGTIAALDLVVTDAGYLADIGPRLYRHFNHARLSGAAARQYDLPDAPLLQHSR